MVKVNLAEFWKGRLRPGAVELADALKDRLISKHKPSNSFL